MKTSLTASFVFLLCGIAASLAGAVHNTDLPEGMEIVPPAIETRVACDVLIRYDDGTDDAPFSGPTLGWYTATDYQFLGVRFTPLGVGSHLVQSASWYSDFWVLNGMVDVSVTEWGNPGNTASASINVTGGGTWEVDFANPICIPEGSEYVVMICPRPGVFGVVGNDLAAPDGRSYWTPSPQPCVPVNNDPGVDYMIWSCVTDCVAVPTDVVTWGQIKSIYR